MFASASKRKIFYLCQLTRASFLFVQQDKSVYFFGAENSRDFFCTQSRCLPQVAICSAVPFLFFPVNEIQMSQLSVTNYSHGSLTKGISMKRKNYIVRGMAVLLLCFTATMFAQQNSIGSIVNKNGTVKTDLQSSYNVRGYHMTLGENNEPVFKSNTTERLTDTYTWGSLGNGSNGTDDRVLAAAVDANGNVYVGGWFTEIEGTPANHIAMWNGSKWSALPSGSSDGVNDVVNAIAVSGTDVYVGGSFTALGDGTPVNYIAKWNGNTWSMLASDSSNGVTGGVPSTSVQVITVKGNDVYVGGQFTKTGDGTSAKNIAKWDGTHWSAFPIDSSNGVNALVWTIAFRGTEMYVGGGFTKFGDGTLVNHIAKWDGSNWSTLPSGSSNGVSVSGAVLTLAVVNDSDVYVGGFFSSLGDGTSAHNIAKWNGSSWSALPTPSNLSNGVNSEVNSIIVSGSNIYVGGFFTQYGNNDLLGVIPSLNYIARWDGSNWSQLGDGVNNAVDAIAINGNDLYAVGKFTKLGNNTLANHIAKWNGSNWSTFKSGSSNGVNDVVNTIAVSGSTVYAGGNFTQFGDGTSAGYVAAWNGNSWNTMSIGFPRTVSAIAVYDNSVFAASHGNVLVWNGVSWIQSPQSLYVHDNSNVEGTVYALASAGGNLYAGGNFTQIGYTQTGNAAYNITELVGNTWTQLSDTSQTNSNGVNGIVYAIAANGNDVYVGGEFTRFVDTYGTWAYHIAKWNGSKWSVLGSDTVNGVLGDVYAIAVNGNDVYVGGAFTQLADGTKANHIAKWDGSRWSVLGSADSNGVKGNVNEIGISGNNVYVGGSFFQLGNGTFASNIAMWDGSKWSAMDDGVDGPINSFAVSAAEGKIYFGGNFQTINSTIAANYIGWFHDPSSTVLVKEKKSTVPKDFVLYQNYPNPFNPATRIQYSVAGSQKVMLKVYDVLGREVATLVNEQKSPGTYEVNFDGSKLASGIYYYRLQSGNNIAVKKMVMIK